MCKSELIELIKTCLSLVSSATLKDSEIEMWIDAGILDLKRQGIDGDKYKEDALIQSAIAMFVKSNFGNTDIREKELAQKTYNLLCCNLGESSDYKVVDSNV